MHSREPELWMWAEACALLDRAERLHRQFFRPARPSTRGPAWEPPVDLFETEDAYWIVVALPGVRANELEVTIDSDVLVVAGARHVPAAGREALIHRLEIPHGRFERQIRLPPGRLELGRRDLADGCLVLSLNKV